MIPYGVHFNLPAETYHALPGASASRLKAFHGDGITPAHARIKIEEPFEPTPWSIMGTLTHLALLEPEKVSQRVIIQPETYGPDAKKWNGNAKDCKAWREAAEKGALILRKPEFDAVEAMVRAIGAKKEAAELIVGARTEVSIIAQAEGHGIPFKARMDIVPAGPVLADLKCVRDVSDRGFTRLAYDRGYHIQAAAYLAVWNAQCATVEKKDQFVFIACENVAPFTVRTFNCTNQFLERGREDMALCLAKYAKCISTGEWSGYDEGYAELGLPGYVERQRYE